MVYIPSRQFGGVQGGVCSNPRLAKSAPALKLQEWPRTGWMRKEQLTDSQHVESIL